MKKDEEKSFGIFPYSLRIVGYILTAIGGIFAVYNAFIAHFDLWESIWNFLVISLTLVVFSKGKIQDERTLYLNTKFLSHSFMAGILVVLIFAILRCFLEDFPQLSAPQWIIAVYTSYITIKIKNRLNNRV